MKADQVSLVIIVGDEGVIFDKVFEGREDKLDDTDVLEFCEGRIKQLEGERALKLRPEAGPIPRVFVISATEVVPDTESQN